MSHREVLEVMSGLLLAMLVAILSSTVVYAALPKIIADVGGGQSAYTWVVTATLLTMTISTPIWGKLADLFRRKLLIQLGIVIYIAASVLAGFAASSAWLIGCRAIQGGGDPDRARPGDSLQPRLAPRTRSLTWTAPAPASSC